MTTLKGDNSNLCEEQERQREMLTALQQMSNLAASHEQIATRQNAGEGSSNFKMDSEVNEHHSKPERLRTRWTASLDKIFADLVVQQILLGNRPNNIFDKKTWNHIRNEFNRQTNLNFNNNQLRKHLDVLRARYHSLKSGFDQNDFSMDDSCCIGFDLWEDVGLQVQPKHETSKTRDCVIYDQLCTIFADSGADGKYAQSSHYEELDKSAGTNAAGPTSSPGSGNQCPKTPSSSSFLVGNAYLPQKMTNNMAERKRKRPSETSPSTGQSSRDQETIAAMAEALSDMVATSKPRIVSMTQPNRRFTISNCIKALDEIQGIKDHLYYAALDLFEEPKLRETFLSIAGSAARLIWLQGKCRNDGFIG